MKSVVLIISLLCLSACIQSDPNYSFKVEHAGALRNMMHKGDLSAKADLNLFKDTENFYALGALENLKGEILILNSEPYISSVNNEALEIKATFDRNATLLVSAAVEKWDSQDIPDSISSYSELEAYIETAAISQGINVEEPFPFLLTGVAESFDWHVINWPEGDSVHSHEKHIHSGLNGQISTQEVEILGFYSRHHHAIFTHHTTNMHLHVRTSNGELSGHVDGLTLGRDMVLALPAAN